MRKQASLRWSLSSNYVRMTLDFAFVVVCTPLLLGTLGMAQYGQWIVLLSAYQMLAMLDLGTHQLLFKLTAHDEALPYEELSAVFVLQLSILGVGLVAFGLLRLCFGGAIHWLYLSGALLLPLRLFQSLLNGTHKMAWSNAAYLAGRLLLALSIGVMAIRGTLTLPALCLAFALSQWLEGLGLLWASKQWLGRLWQHGRRPTLASLKATLLRAQPFCWINVSSVLFARSEALILGGLFGFRVVALYDVAWKLSMYFFTFCRQILHAYSPHLAQRGEGLRRALQQTLRACGVVALPLFFFALWHRELLFRAWLGQVAPETLALFVPLLCVMLLTLLQSIFSTTLGLQEQERRVARFLMARAALRLATSAACGALYGALGYAYGMLLAVVIMDLLFWLPTAARLLSLRVRELLRHSLQACSLPLLGLFLAACWMPEFAQLGHKQHLILTSVLDIGIYVAVLAITYFFSQRKQAQWNTSAS